MNGLRYSQETVAHDEILPEETQQIEMLLNTKMDHTDVVSDGELKQVRIYLDKVSKQVGGTSQEVNHEILQRIFRCLQVWALSPATSKIIDIGIVRNLATIYDNFVAVDYCRSSDVLTSLLELLFVVEDMSDSTEGKIHCGKFFLFRLLALATSTTKSPSVKLQRAAVEAICALVTRCPENQEAVLDQKVECYKLFKVFLPRCGDFQLQGSITEIFYRLVKRGRQLLEFMQDKNVRASMESLMQSKQPNLLAEIRAIVTLVNESQGQVRSVYSFLSERVLINGHEMNTVDKWVNFGRAQLSFFVIRVTELNLGQSSIMDVQYEDIVEINKSSPTLLEILVQDSPGLSSFKAVLGLESGTSSVVHTQMYFNPTDLSTIGVSLLPKLRTYSMARQGKMAANNHFVDKLTSKCSTTDPGNFKSVHRKTANGLPGNEVSAARHPRLLEWAERPGPNDKSTIDCIHSPSDYVSETPEDVDNLEGAANDQSLPMDETRTSKRNQTLSGITTDGPKISKPPGGHAQDFRQPQVASVSSTFERFNPLGPSEQPFLRRQEDDKLCNSNMERPVHAFKDQSLRPHIDTQTEIKRSRKRPLDAMDDNEICENRRTSKPCHLNTQNLHDLSGPKTKSPSDANLYARDTETDDETTDATDNSGSVRELRMKKRQDPQYTNVVPLEPRRETGKNKHSVRNIRDQVNLNVELREGQRCSESSKKNLITPPRDMMASDMTDIREKSVTSGKGLKSCHGRSSRAVPNIATRQGENGEKNSRTPRKRTCKKPTKYFDADDELASAASDSSMEFIVRKQKKSSVMVTDPIINNSAKRRAQTITKCERSAAVREENRPLTACQRYGPLPDKRPSDQKAPTISVSRKQKYSTEWLAKQERKVAIASNSKNDVVEDVFCFNANPGEERQSRRTSLSLSRKARRNSDFAEPYRTKRKKSAAESHNLQSIARQRPCTSDAPRPVILVRPPAKIMKSPPKDSPARSPPEKQDEVTPQQQEQGNVGISSDSDDHSKSPLLQARKTYTKSDRIITKHSRMERWKSFSIRKLELPRVEDTSHDESSDEATQRRSPHAKVIEVEDIAADSDYSSGVGMIAKLLKSFKQKVKLVEKKTAGDILSNTMQRIQHDIQSADERVRGEKTEFMDACSKKYGQLDSDLQGQIKKMQAMYDQFLLDFAQHLERHDVIVGEIEETKLELNDLAKQQGQDHKDVLAKLNDSFKQLLADADQKILDAGKNLTGMRGLKDALQGILKDL